MKQIIFILLVVPTLVYSQSEADSLIKNYKLNFAIPDFPAFKSLGTEPSNILRPSNVEDFGFVSSEFFNGNNLTIPNAFAIEISPVLLMNVNKMTLSDYQKNNAWKTSRLSIGAKRDSLNTSNLSVGYRISVINKGDLRTDKEALNNLTSMLIDRSKLKGQLRTEYFQKNGLLPFDDITDSIEVLINEYIEERIDIKNAEFDIRIKNFKEQYKEDNWNAEKFDLAIAIVGESPDTLLGNIGYNSFSFWATYAKPMFKSKGQFLIGINYRNFNLTDESNNSLSVINRNYFGSNRVKGFIEEQLKYDSNNEGINLLLNLGAELNFNNGFWIDLSAGLNKDFDEDSSKFISQFRFRYSIPEK